MYTGLKKCISVLVYTGTRAVGDLELRRGRVKNLNTSCLVGSLSLPSKYIDASSSTMLKCGWKPAPVAVSLGSILIISVQKGQTHNLLAKWYSTSQCLSEAIECNPTS